jgi:hypothetical protein
MKKSILVLFVLIIVVLAASGCGSDVKDETAYEAPRDQTPATSSQGTAGSTAQSGGQAVSPTPSTPVTSESGPSTADRKLIDDLVASAKQGKVPGCDFAAGKTNYEPTVVDQLGKPDSVADFFPKGQYMVYGSRRITVGVNKGDLLFEVRSFESQYKELTRADLTSVLGKPDSLRYYKDSTVLQDILVYNVSKDFQLLFILPQADKNNPEPHVDHISVVSPKDAINMMAN